MIDSQFLSDKNLDADRHSKMPGQLESHQYASHYSFSPYFEFCSDFNLYTTTIYIYYMSRSHCLLPFLSVGETCLPQSGRKGQLATPKFRLVCVCVCASPDIAVNIVMMLVAGIKWSQNLWNAVRKVINDAGPEGLGLFIFRPPLCVWFRYVRVCACVCLLLCLRVCVFATGLCISILYLE